MDSNVCLNGVMPIDAAAPHCFPPPPDTCNLYLLLFLMLRPHFRSGLSDWSETALFCRIWTSDISPHFKPTQRSNVGPSNELIVAFTPPFHITKAQRYIIPITNTFPSRFLYSEQEMSKSNYRR